MNKISSLKDNELQRLLTLSNLGIDYNDPNLGLDYLTELAAKVSGAQISLVNLIDTFAQWSVSGYGIEFNQIPREESICQWTIQTEVDEGFEVHDLSSDERFKNFFYVKGVPNLRYYMGVPLTLPEGFKLGALCVMDSNKINLSDNVKEILKLIAKQIVDRLLINSKLANLKNKLKLSELSQIKLAHDIRGPIGGIIGLSDLITSEGLNLDESEIPEYSEMIKHSSLSLLDLSQDILSKDFDENSNLTDGLTEGDINLVKLRNTIIRLFAPQIKVKQLDFKVNLGKENQFQPFTKMYVLQILGNLLSNSIKFTNPGGEISLEMNLRLSEMDLFLEIIVEDNGMGIHSSKIKEIHKNGTSTLEGTNGEVGFGLGLNLVRQLVNQRDGTMDVTSEVGNGTKFRIEMKVN
ncbi:histidine kinase/DNA gyrase B/HSP90-like ATPase [Algoriphagus ratkowskyi]|uniref:histidine kinase n=1 Tax=Algoriphagus ratkowskyi TaxID=57028 RepID=A0A2W7QXX6_9BACT|nr:ATP-binding protein [Algoriphagus ratkowskyi]PZX53124.1 histidine kinase/DNA gyrase B/HSP90-like ATPase [Algoriphagus ratkowskyi]TXD76402.1 sensor histidine kinase [Algoriphagus ratkowskyi]